MEKKDIFKSNGKIPSHKKQIPKNIQFQNFNEPNILDFGH
jgi:hypothetical protein